LDFPLKKKVIILISALYIIILGVVLVVGLSRDASQEVSSNSTQPDSPIAVEDTNETPVSTIPENEESTLVSTAESSQTSDETPEPTWTTTSTRQTTPFPTRTSSQSWPAATATKTQSHAQSSATATITQTTVPTSTRTSTTQTQETGWQGEWAAFLEISTGSYTTGTLNIDIVGTDLTGTGIFDGVDYVFDGVLYQDGVIATGSWTTSSDEGVFWWYETDSGEFAGSSENHWGFCGNRSGGGQPDPCLMKPPS